MHCSVVLIEFTRENATRLLFAAPTGRELEYK
jgi:hypothetical protein